MGCVCCARHMEYGNSACVVTASLHPTQAELVCHFYVGETVLSIQKTTLIQGGSECLVYSTLSGSIGALVPFTSKEVGSIADGRHRDRRSLVWCG